MRILRIAGCGGLLLLPSCVHVSSDPIRVEPIEINVNVRVDRQLDDFFSFENKYQGPATIPSTMTTQPTAGVMSESKSEGYHS